MNFRELEVEIDKKNPFLHCKLERKQYADILTGIVKSYPEGFVLAISNRWGTGKTTFVRMWERSLLNSSFQTVYFNAWENDFEENPLIALMGELKKLTNESTKPKFQSALKKASELSKYILPTVAKALAEKYIDTVSISEMIKGVTEGISAVFENEVNEYANRKKTIADFKKNLTEFISTANNGKPVVFIIDELDRCRPNYSVSILEQIKHFFSVPNIVFVLAIDKVELGNAIRGVYGSDRINADEYLRRFIDIEYSIPEPEPDKYFEYLYSYFDFDEFFRNPERIKHGELRFDNRDFEDIGRLIFASSSVPIRKQQKILVLTRLSLRSFKPNQYVIPFIFLFLIFLKLVDNNFYEGLKSRRLSIGELQEKLLNIFGRDQNDNNSRILLILEGLLITHYNNHLNSGTESSSNLYERDVETSNYKLLINSVTNPEKNSQLLDILKRAHSQKRGSLELSYFFRRIDLLENLEL